MPAWGPIRMEPMVTVAESLGANGGAASASDDVDVEILNSMVPSKVAVIQNQCTSGILKYKFPDGGVAMVRSVKQWQTFDSVKLCDCVDLCQAGALQQVNSAALEDLFATADKEPVRNSTGSGSYAKAVVREEDSLSMQEALHLSNLDIRFEC